MNEAFIVDYIRTPIGRYGGVLSGIRTDDLAAAPIRELVTRHPQIDWAQTDEVFLGCANQAGEDNRNVARMAALLADMPCTVPGVTVNRLCGSGMEAVIAASRMIKVGEADLVIAGGVESMSRAPFVLPKTSQAYSRNTEIHDTTLGWRFVNSILKERYGVESMPETAENIAEEFSVSREDQDMFALRSQDRAIAAQKSGRLAREIIPVSVLGRRGAVAVVSEDEHPRSNATLEKLAALPTPFREGGSVTAGNASGVNDGAAAILLASPRAVDKYQLLPMAKVLGAASAGVLPRIMGFGPAPACEKLLDHLGLRISDFDTIELNEAFASQALAVLRRLGVSDASDFVNPNGGAIALGHPLGCSGARLIGTAVLELIDRGQKRALATMCVGVGQGVAIALEAVS